MDIPLAASADPADRLRRWLSEYRRIFVLTGAGCSTASGIPDYRDANCAWKRAQPVTFQAFTGESATYRRYWARSFAGWPRMAGAVPNAAHRALVDFERSGRMSALVTQNVDGLHERAGSANVIDLHGRLDSVVCLDCTLTESRDDTQARMAGGNPGWQASQSTIAPDGDADIDDDAVLAFHPPGCTVCGGQVKPDVVFFGENVPRARYRGAHDALMASDALLVAGSSLMVYSGFRFARVAHESGLPIALLNHGRTRADDLATLKLEAEVGATLEEALR